MFGIGKPRSELGRFIDKKGIDQGELMRASRVNKGTISDLCSGEKDRNPNKSTKIKIISALRKRGYDVKASDFWDV
jgi:hypothetical protein